MVSKQDIIRKVNRGESTTEQKSKNTTETYFSNTNLNFINVKFKRNTMVILYKLFTKG